MDGSADVPLALEDPFEHGQRRSEVLRRLIDRRQRYPATPVHQVIEELHGVSGLLLGLHPHPVGEPWEALRGKVGRHRQVQIGGGELRVDLPVDGLLDLLVHHGVILPSVPGHRTLVSRPYFHLVPSCPDPAAASPDHHAFCDPVLVCLGAIPDPARAIGTALPWLRIRCRRRRNSWARLMKSTIRTSSPTTSTR